MVSCFNALKCCNLFLVLPFSFYHIWLPRSCSQVPSLWAINWSIRICMQQALPAMHLTLKVQRPTTFCFFECHDIKGCPKNLTCIINSLFRYFRTSTVNVRVCYKFKIITICLPYTKVFNSNKIFEYHFMTLRGDSLGKDWNLWYKHALNIMLGLFVIIYKSKAIIPLHTFSRTCSLSWFVSSFVLDVC